jgi:hypothetical protein
MLYGMTCKTVFGSDVAHSWSEPWNVAHHVRGKTRFGAEARSLAPHVRTVSVQVI